LFNALTETQRAEASNYPFCTIEPNKGIVSVPDARLLKLAAAAKTKKAILAQIEFIDIAGLVRGASQGQGTSYSILNKKIFDFCSAKNFKQPQTLLKHDVAFNAKKTKVSEINFWAIFAR